MEIHQLSFGKIYLLSHQLAEVIVNDGVEMNMDMVNEYHDFLRQHLSAPFSLLINKLNKYSYTFEAQQHLATLPEIKAMAVVAYNHPTELATEILKDVPRKIEWNMKIFPEPDSALSWLNEQMKTNSGVSSLNGNTIQ